MTTRGRTRLLAAALVLLASAVVSACGGGSTPTPQPSVAPTPSQSATPAPSQSATPTPAAETVRVYLIRDGKVGATDRSVAAPANATAALNALFSGVLTPADEAGQLSNAIPAGTQLLGTASAAGVLQVNLSAAIATGGGDLGTRLAQVVYTATQFVENERVKVLIGGAPASTYPGVPSVYAAPVGRSDLEDWTPAILVEEPTPGDVVTSPMRVYGTANVFEAEFQVGVMSPGAVMMHEQMVTATSGTGTRGTFDVMLPSPVTGSVNVVAWDTSMKDGSKIHEVYIPLQIR